MSKPKAVCCICRKEEETDRLLFCSKCNLWVHYECAGGYIGGFLSWSSDAKCPNCQTVLKKP
jgi:hypothetical protein